MLTGKIRSETVGSGIMGVKKPTENPLKIRIMGKNQSILFDSDTAILIPV